MNKNFYSKGKRRKKPQSFLLLILLFILATIMPPVVAEISNPTPIVQNQQSPIQLVTQAQELYQNQQFETAATLWKEIADAFEKSGDNLNQAMALSNLSLTYQKLGQWEKAEDNIEESLDLLKNEPQDQGQAKILAQTLDIQGRLQRQRGEAATAIDTWQKAANIYEKLQASTALTRNNLNQAQALQDLGLYPRACQKILMSLNIENIPTCKELDHLSPEELKIELDEITVQPSLLKSLILKRLGHILLVIGKIEPSQKVLKANLDIAKKLQPQLKSPAEIAANYLNIGNSYQALAVAEEEGLTGVIPKRQQYQDKALEFYNKALKSSDDLTIQLQGNINSLNLLINRSEWAKAASLIQKDILSQINNLSPNRSNIYAQINFAHILIELLEPDKLKPPSALELPGVRELEHILIQAIENSRILGDKRFEAYALGNRGRLYELTGQLACAEQYTQQAISIISTSDFPDIAYQYFWQLGRIENRQKRTKKAIAAYTKAYNALQYLRSDIATINPELQFNFRDSVEPVYRELVDLLLREDQPLPQNLILARDVIEALQLAELDNFFQDPCLNVKLEAVDQIVNNAEKSTAVIYGIILEDRLEFILKLPEKEKLVSYHKYISQQDIEEKDIEENINELIERLRDKTRLPEDIKEYSQKLYEWMIRPIEGELQDNNIENLVFVLDDLLRNIPMAVLYDKNKNQYLVEQYPIAIAPGLQLLSTEPFKNIKQNRLNVLTAGLSEERTFEGGQLQFDALGYVEDELEKIQLAVPTSNKLLNENFDYQTLEEQLKTNKYNIVHFATHGEFDSDPDKTFLVLSDKLLKIRELDSLLQVKTGTQPIPIELLVLSACDTAFGDNRATLGLAGVAVRAGVRSSLATLWSVEDNSTAELISKFYHNLIDIDKINKAEALQKAQIEFLQNEEFREKHWDHPYYWSSFILLGNWL